MSSASNPQMHPKEAGIMLGLFFLFLCSNAVHAAKILVIFPHASEGHFAVMRTLVSELAGREHNVSRGIEITCIAVLRSSFPIYICV